MPRRMLFLVFMLGLGLVTQPVTAKPAVVASIKPVHSLVAVVMGEVAEPRLLVSGAQSPHTYAMTPADAAALEQADLVVWVGPALESFLSRPIENLVAADASLALTGIDGLTTHPNRASGVWATGQRSGESPGDGHRGSKHGQSHNGHVGHDAEVDPHIWLNPRNAVAIVTAVARRLAAIDPGNAERYRQNAEQARERLQQLDQRLAERLAPVQDVPYLVFHDAYQYLEARYRLNAAGAIKLNPSRQASAQRILRIRETIDARAVTCIFREPQFASDVVRTVRGDSAIRIATLDPLGRDQSPGANAYFAIMEKIATNLRACLAQ